MTDHDRAHDRNEDDANGATAEERSEPSGAEASEETTSEPGRPSESAGIGPEEAPADTDVFDMLRAAIGLFTQEAWIALGLQPRYGSGDSAMDLRCAKIAIDTTQMLIEHLGDEVDAEEKREFDRILTDLRVNFMRRRKRVEKDG